MRLEAGQQAPDGTERGMGIYPDWDLQNGLLLHAVLPLSIRKVCPFCRPPLVAVPH